MTLFSLSEWEQFIDEWASNLSDYEQVERTGGAGDQGCDVVGLPELMAPAVWDNYQLKDYDHPLMSSVIWFELGKTCFYGHRWDYNFPRRYKFVAPHDVGTSLAKLLHRTEELRRQLFSNWERYCRMKIPRTQEVELIDALKTYIAPLDFSVFGYKPLLKVIEDHKNTHSTMWRDLASDSRNDQQATSHLSFPDRLQRRSICDVPLRTLPG